MRQPLAAQLVALSIFAAHGSAQSIVPTVPTPIAMSIRDNGATLFAGAVPSGALAAGGSITIGQPGTQAELRWDSTQSNKALTFAMHWESSLTSPTANASLQGQGLLLSLSAPFASQAMLELAGTNSGFPGGSPSLSIDVGDDGLVEFTELTPSTLVQIVLGPVPTLVRMRIDANQVASGDSTLFLRCFPDNGSDVQAWDIGCEQVPVGLQSTFDGNFELAAAPYGGQPTVAVLALRLQSTVIGSSFGLPCTLLPAPDLVLAFPSPTLTSIVVPPAVRPLLFFAQGVHLGLFGLATGTAYVARAL